MQEDGVEHVKPERQASDDHPRGTPSGRYRGSGPNGPRSTCTTRASGPAGPVRPHLARPLQQVSRRPGVMIRTSRPRGLAHRASPAGDALPRRSGLAAGAGATPATNGPLARVQELGDRDHARQQRSSEADRKYRGRDGIPDAAVLCGAAPHATALNGPSWHFRTCFSSHQFHRSRSPL